MMEEKHISADLCLVPEFLRFGQKVYSYDFIEEKRSQKPRDPKFISPQKGGQEALLTSEAQIIIYGGVRGGGKSGGLLLKAYDYIDSPYFSGAIFRKEKDDAKKVGGIIDQSHKFYSELGEYNRAEQDRTWNFYSGGRLNFGYYSDSYDDFVTRYQGMELAYIGIDEITHMKYPYFKYLLTCNRNSHGLPNKIIGTCNPDPDSWVVRFIGGEFTAGSDENGNPVFHKKWIGDDGYPIPEMNGKILYCFMWGDREDQIYWGETKEAVYEQAKEKIDDMWNDELAQFGNKLDMFIISATYIIGRLEDNKILLESDPSYFKNLTQQNDERRLRDLKGNWLFKTKGDGLLSRTDIESFLENSYQRSEYCCMTADIATTGGDKAVLYAWEGFHLVDIEAYKVDSQTLLINIRKFMEKHRISEEDFCYDDAGIGKYIEGFMPKAIRFIGNASPTDKTEIRYGGIQQKISRYENIKSQCIDLFCDRMKLCGYSVDYLIAGRYYFGKRFRDHIKEEYMCLRRDNRVENKFKVISKAEMTALIGHSPDFIDALYQREYIELLKKDKKVKRIGACYL